MTDRGPGEEDRRDDDELRRRDEFTLEGGHGSNGRDRTHARERVMRGGLDEAGEIPAADADVEAGVSRRAERYED
ncbi:MAG TPA: hypothetical protein VFZ21_23275 [Gemmatimonadaceae bacterium]|nr:hypothetical protein [Gemmatimonadaceae bacterium]